ncbi:hypothetical protein TIFTF001_024238 [Ficus carica]|uniref:Uncharacterized protein n=1 Tax=Ficus carica TaxID=3494 RepID=A0AA88AHM7_FICCA|nr:hypothetical protein TIFTF001_024238 [Ficus carica]
MIGETTGVSPADGIRFSTSSTESITIRLPSNDLVLNENNTRLPLVLIYHFMWLVLTASTLRMASHENPWKIIVRAFVASSGEDHTDLARVVG